MNIQRREFLAAGAAALATGATPIVASAQSKALAHPIGDFVLRRSASGLTISHKQALDRILWETADGNFLVAEVAQADIKDFGTPEAFFTITDTVRTSYGRTTIDTIEITGNTATVSGKLTGPGKTLQYKLAFEALSTSHLRFVVSAVGPGAADINRIRLLVASTKDEGFFGFGEQLTYFNQKGNVLPILVQEHGVGRGRPIVTELVDLFASRGGGNPYLTEAPAPHFISSRVRSLFLENLEYSEFDLRPADHVSIKVWSGTMTGRILYGETPLDLIEAYTEYAGRMRILPDWVHSGVILGIGGGGAAVSAKLAKAREAGIPIAGLWIQDWVGVRATPAGTQLWWNWKLDETYYANWKELVAELERQGARMLTYINPFLSNETGHDSLFNEAHRNGYLVEKADGSPYLLKNSSFRAGLIDLSNPHARPGSRA
jgi:sulfoquinovosidase